MSSTPHSPETSVIPGTETGREQQKVTVVSHSNLFYWWPVWAVGFLMAFLTVIDKHLMVIVPKGTKAVKKVTVDHAGSTQDTEAYVLPKDMQVERVTKDPSSETLDPKIRMSHNKNYGVIFCFTLMLVITITNVPLRGMWSLVVIITVILLTIIFMLAGWWERILSTIEDLHIYINLGGYLFISTILFVIWLGTILFFDQQTYIVFEPGQFRVCTEIGGGEKVYDTIGMTLERQRSDLFRHMILGLGSGDLIVKTTGAQAHHFDLPNVLFISRKLAMIENLLRQKKMLEMH